ncbi:hypothetical protein HMPREF1150_0148 [Streptococcus sp. AS14]|nr:hypothetical protein HMPREF1150_0148 [Streptococcus sp. AS14]
MLIEKVLLRDRRTFYLEKQEMPDEDRKTLVFKPINIG